MSTSTEIHEEGKISLEVPIESLTRIFNSIDEFKKSSETIWNELNAMKKEIAAMGKSIEKLEMYIHSKDFSSSSSSSRGGWFFGRRR